MITGFSGLRAGLLGEKLSHSFSPQLHSMLADYSYELFEVPADRLADFMRSDRFDALNVTIPYKKAVMPYLDRVSPEAQRIGAVNTIVRGRDGLCGYNTDYHGFLYTLRRLGVPTGGKALVLGSGGASATAVAALSDAGTDKVVVISRSGKDNYENISDHADAELIVNATPVGMYPSPDASPLSLKGFPRLRGVIDLIYNPNMTELMFEARELGIPASGGLPMLVSQGVKACEIFTGGSGSGDRREQTDETRTAEALIARIKTSNLNIVLIGMPGSGKTVCGKAVAAILGREFVDIDELIERECGKSITRIFAEDGQEYFRETESRLTALAAMRSGTVIATGGGVVTRLQNRIALQRNSAVIRLMRDTEKLATNGRPLSLARGTETLLKERGPLYRSFAHGSVTVTEGNVEATAREIIAKMKELCENGVI